MRVVERSTPVEDQAPMGNTLGSMSAAVRRYWWVVLGVVLLALLGAALATATAQTTYVGRTSLIVASNDRSPEQDAVLVQGYVAYFDNAAYQQQLLAEARVDPSGTVAAQAAAASPILVITATASDPAAAQSAAIAVARAFRDDINEVHARATEASLATLQDQLDTAIGGNSADKQAVIGNLQDQIREIQADQDNVLQELQSRGGVSSQPPSWVTNLALALAGSLLLGLLGALALARLSPRLRSSFDATEKIGIATLVELPGQHSKHAPLRREERLRQLANILRARLGRPGIVAVTQARDGAATLVVAQGLASEWAAQGFSTVLIRFGAGHETPAGRAAGASQESMTPAEASAALSRMRPGSVPGIWILDLRLRLVGGAASLPASKVGELLQLDALSGSFVVIETPAVVNSAIAQAATLAADATILVIDTQVDKVAETREAVEVLRQSGVRPVGAVLASVGDEKGDPEIDDWSEGQLHTTGSDRLAATSHANWSW
jgi:hypothetical protein